MNNREKILIVLLELGLIAGGQWFVLANFGTGNNSDTNGIWEWILSSVVLLGVVPILTIKYFFKESLAKYFVTVQGEKGGWLSLIFSSLVFFGLMALLMIKLNWWESTPISVWLLSGSIGVIVFVDFLLMPFVILANEIFFRGFVMVLLASWLGSWRGIFIQAVLATFYKVFFLKGFQLDKITMLLLLNIFLGYICFRKRTVFASAVVNWLIYVSVDLAVFYQVYQLK